MPPLSYAAAEAAILDRELFGMRFGLERMRRLMTALGHPERTYATVHVVGTNGKSSTTRMIAELLTAHGLRTGAYLSPHLVSFAERIRVDGADITDTAFARAVERTLAAAAKVDRTDPEPVTQFELLTAAAYSELAAAEVEAAVIEAGLGGRYDATNVIPSTVTVLTGVGLEHTRWLGPTHAAIAREKVDVLGEGSVLVLGPRLHPDAAAVALEVAAQRAAQVVEVTGPLELPGLHGYQRDNFAVAHAAASELLGALGREVSDAAVRATAATVSVPGRLQLVDTAPLTLLDGAHNPDGIAALALSLDEVGPPETPARPAGGSGPTAGAPARRIAVLSILDDKDATSMLAALAPRVDGVVATRSHHPRALPPPTLGSLMAQLDGPPVEVVADPAAALERARVLAGPDGLVVATGSIYLIADLLTPADRPAVRRSSL